MSRQRSVRFAPAESMKDVNYVLHHNDYDENERFSCWYDNVDIQLFRIETDKDAYRALFWKGDETRLCKRGLEPHSPKGSRQRKRTIRAARKAVLDHQATMYASGGSSSSSDDDNNSSSSNTSAISSSSSSDDAKEDCLAKVYQSYSIPSQNLAQERALV